MLKLKTWLLVLMLSLSAFQSTWAAAVPVKTSLKVNQAAVSTPAALTYQLKAASGLSGKLMAAENAHVQYVGRWDSSLQGQMRTGRGAVYVKANFTGPSLAVKLRDKGNWWRYSIDGQEFKRFLPEQKAVNGLVTLAENLPGGSHSLLLARDTEGRTGVSSFQGWQLAPGGKFLAAAKDSGRRIEFVGDSILAGAFAYGPGPYVERENGYMAYGPQLARMLQADWSVVAKSGEGVYHNYWEEEEAKKSQPVIHAREDYLRTFFSEPKPLWQFKGFVPQLIIVSYGSNDFSNDFQPDKDKYITAYEQLLQTIRRKNPQARIICLEPVPYCTDRKAGEWAHLAVRKRQADGDGQLYYWTVNRFQPCLEDEYLADGEHPLIKGHTKLALYLKDRVARFMGW